MLRCEEIILKQYDTLLMGVILVRFESENPRMTNTFLYKVLSPNVRDQ
jgi:hypothetical protein